MPSTTRGQSAIEYLILLGAVVALVLMGFQTYLPRFRETSNIYYNRVAEGIMGDAPSCGDGVCDQKGQGWPENCRDCPTDCGECNAGGVPPGT